MSRLHKRPNCTCRLLQNKACQLTLGSAMQIMQKGFTKIRVIPRTPGRARAKPARALVGGALKRDRAKTQSVCLSVGNPDVTIAPKPITHTGAFMTSHSL